VSNTEESASAEGSRDPTTETKTVTLIYQASGRHKVLLSPDMNATEMRKVLEHGLRCIRKAIIRGHNIHKEVARDVYPS
jgi:hypothetical protein